MFESLRSHALQAAAPLGSGQAVLALGPQRHNSAGLLVDAQWWASPLHGDLHQASARDALSASAETLLTLAQRRGWRVVAVAHDPHSPSTGLAQQLAHLLDCPAQPVPHHHAHLAVVQAEQGWRDTQARLGLVLDGMSPGADGSSWGGELLLLKGPQLQRLGHLPALALPGGEEAAQQPWRLAAALLQRLGQGERTEALLGAQAGTSNARMVAQMLARKALSPLPQSTAAQCWLDAVAALLGLHATPDQTAAQALEHAATQWLAQGSPAAQALQAETPPLRGAVALHAPLDLDPLARELLALGPNHAGEAAARFQLRLADALAQAAHAAALQHGCHEVLLAGTCFNNPLLRTRLTQQLQLASLPTHQPQLQDRTHTALGQAWTAALQLTPTHPRQPQGARDCVG
ncbi:carbamoyltransferase HypF [Roseateles sp. BYS180W]|uniref:Kae1-like domain-containing protein n=1 Tax=Roseateles rivi TaxID=3299028 RepID=UPI00374933A9